MSEVAGNRKLLLAYSSYRPRGRGLNIYFYEHDGQRAGKHVGQVEVDADGSMLRPSLSADGTLCAFAYQSYEASNGSAIRLWSVANKEYLILDGIASPVPQMQPAISGDGRWIAFSAWQRPGGSGGWDVHLYDRAKGTLTPLPGLNTEFDELSPSISFDGGLVAFVSDRPTGEDGRARRQRVYVYERATRRTVNLPGLGADAGTWRDWDPALSGDGRFLAFTSDRPGPGGLFVGYSSVYLYDRGREHLTATPDLNSQGAESLPALSLDGRYLAFTSERMGGAGHRDLFLYDCSTHRLLATPELNSQWDDAEPSLGLG